MECDYICKDKKCSRKTDVGVCGYHSKHRSHVSVKETIGRRKSMEDRYVINRNDDYELYGVFDGHGGKEASRFVEKYFSNFNLDIIEPIETMAKTFHEIIFGLHHMSKGKVKESGTTASIVLIYKKLNKMIAINIGDSRIMIFNESWSKIVTKDHNVGSNKKDVKTLSSKGTKIEDNYVVSGSNCVNLTRTIGDHDFDTLIRLPEIYIVDLDEVSGILISCDGLWEESKEKDLYSVIDLKDINKSCKALIDKALKDGSSDNITVMIVKIK